MFAHRCIAKIGQMPDLNSFAESGILDFHKIADMHIFGQFGAGAQAGEGADRGTPADMAAFQMAKPLDFGPGFNRHPRPENHIRADHRIAANEGVQRKEHGIGGGHRYTDLERVGTRAGLKRGFRPGQFGAGVNAKRFRLITNHDACGKSLCTGDPDNICQIVFARRIVIANSSNKVGQNGKIGTDHTGIAQGNFPLGVACILELDDPFQHIAFGDQAAIATRISRFKPQHNHCITRPRGAHQFQSFGANERGIAIKDQGIAGCILQRRQRLCDSMTGAKPFRLFHHGNRVIKCQSGLCDQLCAVACHHDHTLRPQRLTRPQRVMQQGGRTDMVQHFRQIGIHPRALSRREDNQ